MATTRTAITRIAVALVEMGVTPPPHQSESMAARFLAKAAKPPPERQGERVVSGDALVPVVINGTTLHLRIEPGVPGAVIVAPALNERLGLKGNGLLGLGVCYGDHICGRTQVVRFGWRDEKAEKRRIVWMSHAYQPPADGTVGPAGLPDAVIRFALRPARAGEQTIRRSPSGSCGPTGS